MWTWTLNWGEVGPTLLVGSCPMRPTDLTRIRRQSGVTAILSLQHDDCLAYWGIDYVRMLTVGTRDGLRMKRCPMRDFNIEDQQRSLPAAVAMLTRLQQKGHRTYVHCTAGLGRSPLTVWAYLVMVEGWEPSQAIAAIRRVRPAAVPSWEALQGCREHLLAEQEANVAQRAYALYCQGTPGDAGRHWFLAQQQILREWFVDAAHAVIDDQAPPGVSSRHEIADK